jgi:hypothetical protein
MKSKPHLQDKPQVIEKAIMELNKVQEQTIYHKNFIQLSKDMIAPKILVME